MRQPATLDGLYAPPLAWWTMRPGLARCETADSRAWIAYRVSDGVAVTVGEPVGDPALIPALIERFKAECRERGLTPCWWHVTGRWLPELRAAEAGMRPARLAQIGGYAVVDLPQLRFSGRRLRTVRTALNVLPQLGYLAQWYDFAADPRGWRGELEAISADWLARRRLPEIRHSMGSWDSALNAGDGLRWRVLCGPDGQPCAFMSFAPLYIPGGGYGLDMLRGRVSLPRDSMLFLLAGALLDFKAEGLAACTLGLAPLSIQRAAASVRAADGAIASSTAAGRLRGGRADEDRPVPDAPLPLRALRGLAWQRSGRLYNFQGLALFKRRFAPRWEPRYVVYPAYRSIPRILRALCHVHGLRARLLWRILLG